MRKETKINIACIVVALILVIGMWVWLIYAIGLLSRLEVEKKTWHSGDPQAMIQGNSLIAISEPVYLKEIGRVYGTITAYSSTVEQCDSTPFITASGQRVREGIIANNYYPFGTKAEVIGVGFFEIQDRMSIKYDGTHLDIWFPSEEEAFQWGIQNKEVVFYE